MFLQTKLRGTTTYLLLTYYLLTTTYYYFLLLSTTYYYLFTTTYLLLPIFLIMKDHLINVSATDETIGKVFNYKDNKFYSRNSLSFVIL